MPFRATADSLGAPSGVFPGGRHTLRGFEAMTFSTEVLPLLSSRDDVRVELTGRVPDYHEAGDTLEIGLSAGELDGDRDWFDLGISVTVEGREVPFADLFVALAHGQSHMLLADGAYFSLDKPELATLARLIEEAKALQDQPDGALRISRFQAGLWEELSEIGSVSHQAARWQEQVRGLLAVEEIDAVPLPATTQRAAQALPGVRLPLARVPVAARARRHPGRRHGPRKDTADPGAAATRQRHQPNGFVGTRSAARLSSSWRRPPCSRTGRPRRTGSPRT